MASTAPSLRSLSRAFSVARPHVRSANPGLRATIFGAYGFVGRYVTNLLAADGVQCIIPWRGDDMEWRHLKVNGDLGIVMPRPYSPRDKDSMRRCIEGSDIVINLCGKVRAPEPAEGPDRRARAGVGCRPAPCSLPARSQPSRACLPPPPPSILLPLALTPLPPSSHPRCALRPGRTTRPSTTCPGSSTPPSMTCT